MSNKTLKKVPTVQPVTVGKASSELIVKADDNTHSAHDQMVEQLSDYEEEVYEAIARGKKDHEGDFYVVVLTKKERLMQNVLRNYFFTRHSCPTPDWDQTVYRYTKDDDQITFLWTLPARDVCADLKASALFLDAEDRELLEYVMALDDGTLLIVSKKLNGESIAPQTSA